MKLFLIGDGQKYAYFRDDVVCNDSGSDSLQFDSERRKEIPIYLSVISIEGDEKAKERLREDYRARAKSVGAELVQVNQVLYYVEEPGAVRDDGSMNQFAYAVIENHVVVASANYPTKKIDSARTSVEAELGEILQSLGVRKHGQELCAELYQSHIQRIRESRNAFGLDSCNNDLLSECLMLQPQVEAIINGLEGTDRTRVVALAFGTILQNSISGLQWKLLIDDDGHILCLRYRDSTIKVFPTAMIWKRVERKESFLLVDLVEGTIDAIEDLIRRL